MQKSGNDNKPNAEHATASTPPLVEPDRVAENMARIIEDGSRALATMIERSGGTSGPVSEGVGEATAALASVYANWMSDPTRFAQAQSDLMQGYAQLWTNQMARMMGATPEPVARPEPGDNRFRDADWVQNPYFDFLKQFYLLTAQWSEDLVRDADGVDEATRHRAEFYLRQLASALAPTNFAVTNPEVIRETLASQGENLARGMEQFLADVERSGEMLKIAQTDLTAFQVGENLATTPGKVVFQNDVMQLLQYSPTTEQVHFRPLLIVPPWINKFYVLDLNPKKSMVQWLVEQGYTVFMISWVNPGEAQKDETWESYMDAVLEAIDKVLEETGQPKLNIASYCIGATMTGGMLAHMAKTGDDRIQSATMFTGQFEFSSAGDLQVLVDEETLTVVDEQMDKGFLPAESMANAFNMLRSSELIWGYVVQNYMLGKDPFPFDLLYWNADQTNIPGQVHLTYLKELYGHNALSRGVFKLFGEEVSLGDVTIPITVQASRDDHICPYDSVYRTAKAYGGPTRFILAGSGHIAGVVNHPDANKYQHWLNDGDLADDAHAWLEGASEIPGSWWTSWWSWLQPLSGRKVKARITEDAGLGDAPGYYVTARMADIAKFTERGQPFAVPAPKPVAKPEPAPKPKAKTAAKPKAKAAAETTTKPKTTKSAAKPKAGSKAKKPAAKKSAKKPATKKKS